MLPRLARRVRLRLEPLDDRWLMDATSPVTITAVSLPVVTLGSAPVAPAVAPTTQAASPTFDLLLAELPADQVAGRAALIDWGDGTRSAALVQFAGTDQATVRGTKSFPSPGTYSVTLTLTPADGNGNTRVIQLSITVRSQVVPRPPADGAAAPPAVGGAADGTQPQSPYQLTVSSVSPNGDTIIFISEVRRLGDSFVDGAPFRGRQDYAPAPPTLPPGPLPGPTPPTLQDVRLSHSAPLGPSPTGPDLSIPLDARASRFEPLGPSPTRPGPDLPTSPGAPRSDGTTLGAPALVGANGTPATVVPVGLRAWSAPGAGPTPPGNPVPPAGGIVGPAWSSGGVLQADGTLIVAAELDLPTAGPTILQTTVGLAERCDALVRRLAEEPLPEEQAGLPPQAPPPDTAVADEGRRLWPVWLVALGLVGWSARTLVGPRSGRKQTGPTVRMLAGPFRSGIADAERSG